jgi:hypothetical protein
MSKLVGGREQGEKIDGMLSKSSIRAGSEQQMILRELAEGGHTRIPWPRRIALLDREQNAAAFNNAVKRETSRYRMLIDTLRGRKDQLMVMAIDPDIAGIIPGAIYVSAWDAEAQKWTTEGKTVFVDNAGNKTTLSTFVVLVDKDGNLSLSSRPVRSDADAVEVLKEAEKEGKHIADSTIVLDTEFIKEQNKQELTIGSGAAIVKNPNPNLLFSTKRAKELRNGATFKPGMTYLVMPKTNTAEDMAPYEDNLISSLTELQSDSPLIGLGSPKR